MTSFLANLVERSLGSAPAVQPRLPWLFEPVTQIEGEMHCSPTLAATGIEALKAVASNEEARPSSRQETAIPSAPPERETQAGPTLVAPAVPVVVPPANTERAPTLSSTEPKATSVVVAVSTATTRGKESASPVLEMSGESSTEAVPPPTLLLPIPASVAESVVAPAPTSAAPVVPNTSLAERAPRPIIHVRIGRIDLRAVAAADPPKPPPAKPKPGLSLEDYLKSRKEGER
jgi:hypothetical protein